MLLKEFRSHAQGLPDLLPWAALIVFGANFLSMIGLVNSGALI